MCVWLKEGSSWVLFTFCYSFHTGAAALWLLPRQQAANNEVWTGGCGVRPPRATGRTIPPTPPPRGSACFWAWESVGGHDFGQLCMSDPWYLVERWGMFWCSVPPLPHHAEALWTGGSSWSLFSSESFNDHQPTGAMNDFMTLWLMFGIVWST